MAHPCSPAAAERGSSLAKQCGVPARGFLPLGVHAQQVADDHHSNGRQVHPWLVEKAQPVVCLLAHMHQLEERLQEVACETKVLELNEDVEQKGAERHAPMAMAMTHHLMEERLTRTAMLLLFQVGVHSDRPGTVKRSELGSQGVPVLSRNT
eukprot:CAMPEP_0115271100 /NCGR_PEP_ID=MMETSP0270-20121206/53918_1 /TAXON_ID=71861 /ORGANISM="Scrippsiella trochoidea, Strain CCMP3099" /LENGTH=151 /DNA_ID=CAMNT_0002687435 /DNA_START=201 /DNA_END=654 /DNA_ORIENTATION=-